MNHEAKRVMGYRDVTDCVLAPGREAFGRASVLEGDFLSSILESGSEDQGGESP